MAIVVFCIELSGSTKNSFLRHVLKDKIKDVLKIERRRERL